MGDGEPRGLASTDVRQHLAAAYSHSPAIAVLDLRLAAASAAAGDVRYDGLPTVVATGSAGFSSLDTTASVPFRALAGDDALPTWSAGLSSPYRSEDVLRGGLAVGLRGGAVRRDRARRGGAGDGRRRPPP